MLDPNKMTVQYGKVINRHPTKWYFLNPKDPELAWRHVYKKVYQKGTYFLPHTFPSHPNQRKFLIQDTSIAHFKFTRFQPHDLFINIIDGDNTYQINDGGSAFVHGAHRLRIYNSGMPLKHGVIYRDYPQIKGRQSINKNLRIMMYHLCAFTDEIMQLIS